MIELPEQIQELRGASLLRGVDLAWIEPSKMEMPYRELLFHSRDMTSTLAKFHGAEIELRVIQESRREGSDGRGGLLSAGEKPVEYGWIEVNLDHFDDMLREKVLGGMQPLGGILNDSGFRVSESASGLFSDLSGRFFT